MNSIFVSHASDDAPTVASICKLVECHGFRVWVSFRDIPAGSNWDLAIEAALRQSSCIVVICSRSSVASSYVRAEVEEALRQDKTVIPIIIDDCELPIRWKMLQWIRWSDNQSKERLEALRLALPETALANLRSALGNGKRLSDVKAILQSHCEWLPIEVWMRPEYIYQKSVAIRGDFPVDVFAGRMDSIGPRAFLYYFGPYEEAPFDQNGLPHRDIAITSEIIGGHVAHLFVGLPTNHPLAPSNLFNYEADHWRDLPDSYASVYVYFVFGRRHHLNDEVNALRKSVRENMLNSWRKYTSSIDISLELLTYDRLIGAAEKTSNIRPPLTH